MKVVTMYWIPMTLWSVLKLKYSRQPVVCESEFSPDSSAPAMPSLELFVIDFLSFN